MFSILFRVLTIAGTFTIAALLTRRYLQQQSDSSESDSTKCDAGPRSLEQRSSAEKSASASHPESGPELRGKKKQRGERMPVRHGASAEQVAAMAPSTPVASADAPEKLKAAAPVASAQTAAPQTDETAAAAERARVVIESSKQILTTYKQPEGLTVDLSLAHFSLDTAERLMKEGKYDDAWEKAGAIGMVVGMSEMRAGIERHLKNHKPDEKTADKVAEIRKILGEADASLAEATKSFVMDETAGESEFLDHLRSAFRKTTAAQTKVLEVVI